jgi:hypothetical protein
MVKTTLIFCFLLVLFSSSAQELRDFISTSPIFVKGQVMGSQENPRRFYESIIDNKEYFIYSNYFMDSTAFDFMFDRRSMNLKSNDKIKVELKDGNRTVYSRVDSVGHFNNVHFTNFPSCTECYAIRIDLSKNLFMFLNEDNEATSFKLFITDIARNKIIYGNGPNDLAFKFLSKP